MKRSISSLKDDHEVIKKALSLINEVTAKNDIQTLEKIVDFIENFVDKCHHAKEEKVLFPFLEERGIPKEGGPIFVMLYEHNELRELVQKIKDSINNKRFNEVKELLDSLALVLLSHIDKEDNVLFPMSEGLISDEEDKELLEKFEGIEKDFGLERHKGYVEMIDSLYRKYLS